MVEAAGIEPETGTKPNLVMACDFRYKWFDSNAFEQVWLSPGVVAGMPVDVGRAGQVGNPPATQALRPPATFFTFR